jgi:ABC-type multidrug transport system fused ATPase/permease subunit
MTSGNRYSDVLHACVLEADLAQLPNADATIIGERGLNLSGGQKARIALARLCYADADVCILDDILAAVDVHVASALMKDCICGLLGRKTRVLVTNSLAVLREADSIVVIDKHTIVATGTHAALLARKDVIHLLSSGTDDDGGSSHGTHSTDGTAPQAGTAPKALAAAADGAPKKEEEVRQSGHVQLKVYGDYFKAGGGVLIALGLFFLGWFCPQALVVLGEFWLAQWTTNVEGPSTGSELAYYGGVYVLSTSAATAFVVYRSIFWARFAVQASGKMHSDLLERVLRLPMSFFEVQPLGRILNRFSSDIDQVDTGVDSQLNMALEAALKCVTALAMATYVLPPFVVVVGVVSTQYVRIANYFRKSVRELKRLQSTTRSPVLAHFAETLAGRTTVRAYGAGERFMQVHVEHWEQHARAWMGIQGTQRWLMVRMASVAAVLQVR